MSTQTKIEIDRPTIQRCPACGHRIEEAGAPRCPLCQFEFGGGRRVTADDATPYATAYSEGRPGWRAMAEWVWFAGSQRLAHLSLIQASAASRNFARWNVFVLSLAMAIFQATSIGWRWVSASAEVEPTGNTRPTGYYWMHVAGAPRPLPENHPAEKLVDLWWNPIHAVVGLVTGFVATWVVVMLLATFLRVGLSAISGETYQREKRFTAAIHYGTAWAILFALAALVAALRPISYVGQIARWGWYPPAEAFTLSAAVLAGLGAVMWWYWLVRLGSTVPAKVRGGVTALFAVGTPVVFGGLAAGWYYGLPFAYDRLFATLKLAF